MIDPEFYNTIVDTVDGWLQAERDDIRREFIECEERNLIQYHHSLGRNIRNEFNLWTLEWEPEIVDGFDMSPNHPDAISHRVIVDVWKRHTSPE